MSSIFNCSLLICFFYLLTFFIHIITIFIFLLHKNINIFFTKRERSPHMMTPKYILFSGCYFKNIILMFIQCCQSKDLAPLIRLEVYTSLFFKVIIFYVIYNKCNKQTSCSNGRIIRPLYMYYGYTLPSTL